MLIDAAEQGKDVVVKDATGNVVETLPESAVNKEGNTIGFYYTVKNGNQLQVTQTGANGAVTYGWWSDWGKCAVGTGGVSYSTRAHAVPRKLTTKLPG